jgi:hypothetical protein
LIKLADPRHPSTENSADCWISSRGEIRKIVDVLILLFFCVDFLSPRAPDLQNFPFTVADFTVEDSSEDLRIGCETRSETYRKLRQSSPAVRFSVSPCSSHCSPVTEFFGLSIACSSAGRILPGCPT